MNKITKFARPQFHGVHACPRPPFTAVLHVFDFWTIFLEDDSEESE